MTLNRDTIAEAAIRIAPFIRKTPVMDIVLPGIENPVCLKLELFQHTGSFKPRGAFTNLVGAQIPEAGVAAASGGNHGAAVAYAAKVLGIAARIFVPTISSPAKIARIADYGATIVQEGANYQEAAALCQDYVRESGALNIHAYDMETTLAGQGTLALELEQQAADLDAVLVAVGGGGLIGGIASWYQMRTKVVGVEPETCNCLSAALTAGTPTTIKPSGLATDSLGASAAGSLMFPIAQRYVGHVALVSDEDIRNAQRYLWTNMQIVTEPGGATALAALLSGAYKPAKDERVGVIVCGANTPLETFKNLFSMA
ncbi:MAG: threonine/serine dehydratase [Aestuariivirga sp.]